MKKLLLTLSLILFIGISFTQQIITNSKLIINHQDMVLYLESDTNTMISVHTLTYKNYQIIDSPNAIDRKKLKDPWFDDTYKGKFKEKYYTNTKKDKGHLTPFKATSYSKETAINSFSSYNQAPQDYYFNEHPWEQLEQHVLDSIKIYKKDAIIITGVIYNNNNKPTYLSTSRIKIPTYYYKILYIDNKKYYWLGDNTPGLDNPITPTTLDAINKLFVINKMDVKIK